VDFLTRHGHGETPRIQNSGGCANDSDMCSECYRVIRASFKLCSCVDLSYCSQACAVAHRPVHAMSCPTSDSELVLKKWPGETRAQMEAEVSHLPETMFSLGAIGETWENYFTSRGMTPHFEAACTTVLTDPLTILMAMRRFDIVVAPGEILRIDLPGSACRELLFVKDVLAELGRAFPENKLHVRLVGPNLDLDKLESPFKVANVTAFFHKAMYEEVLAADGTAPHLAVAFIAGIRESWFAAIRLVIKMRVPMAITGFDLEDVAGGLRELFDKCDPEPKVVMDGVNPFGSRMSVDMKRQEGYVRLDPTPIEDHPVIERARSIQSELAAGKFQKSVEQSMESMLPGLGSDKGINTYWYLIHGEMEETSQAAIHG